MPPYEVWCHSCNVTFPPEQKRCLHCGARTRPDSPDPGLRRGQDRTFGEISMSPVVFESQKAPPDSAPEMPFSPGSSDGEEEPVRRSLLRAGMTVVWMVLLAAGYAWRACSQSP